MRRTKKSAKNTFFIVAAVVAVAAAAGYVAFKDKSGHSTGDVVVAQINGKPVYSSEADRQLYVMLQGNAKEATFSQLDEAAKMIVLKEIAAQKRILADAYKQGFENKKDIKEKVDAYKEGVVKEEFLADLAKKQVTDEAIKARYDEDSQSLKGKEQYKVKHIVLKTEGDAEAAKKLLKKETFEQVAKEKSVDEKTALTGGDLGYLVDGSMIPEFEAALKDLKKGEISEPVKTKFGWHLIKLEDKAAAEPAPYDQVKGLLARALYKEAIQNYVKEVVDNAKINIAASAEGKKAAEPAAPAEDKAEDLEKDDAAPADSDEDGDGSNQG